MISTSDVCVIGGGAAGLMAAVAAAQQGASVIVVEQLSRIGKKILATGNGHCNYTNASIRVENYHSSNPDFVSSVIQHFSSEKIIHLFRDFGIEPSISPDGRIFPASQQASSILDVLRHALAYWGVSPITDVTVKKIQKKNHKFIVTSTEAEVISASAVILATGGKAAPQLGSNGSGYLLAKSFGHAVISPFPALVQLCLKASYCKRLKGIRWQAGISLLDHHSCSKKWYGEVLFTDYGISGIPILQCARYVNKEPKTTFFLSLDFMPDYTVSSLLNLLEIRQQQLFYKTLEESLIGLLPKRFIPVLCQNLQIAPDTIQEFVTHKDLIHIANVLKKWKIQIIGTRTWKDAQVTAGGIDTKNIKSETMGSTLMPGLFFAGEIMDVDGDCGGYNLHWAWASGMISGSCAAEYIQGNS